MIGVGEIIKAVGGKKELRELVRRKGGGGGTGDGGRDN